MTGPDADRPGQVDFDVAVIGAGSAAGSLAGHLSSTDLSVVTFEHRRVGGECPFTACIPSKTLLHSARSDSPWPTAAERRDSMVGDLDDTSHAESLRDDGATLIREPATIVDPTTVEAGGERYTVGHVVIATGSEPVQPDITGLDQCADRLWTSADAMTTAERPHRLCIVGAGAVGAESAFVFGGFGVDVTLVGHSDRFFDDAPPRVSEILASQLDELGVDTRRGVEARRLTPDGDAVAVELSDGTTVRADRVLLSVGRRPATSGIGLERLGIEPGEPLPLEPNLQVRCDGSVWAIGDVAGLSQHTHVANHHAAVVADHLAGTATRREDDVVVPGCVFHWPPMIQIGASWRELRDDADIVSSTADVGDVARSATDDLPDGHLWVAARRSTGCIAAAAGIGPSFDELTHALVIAIDGRVPVARLRQTMQPFPTIGEVLGPIFDDLHDQLTST